MIDTSTMTDASALIIVIKANLTEVKLERNFAS